MGREFASAAARWVHLDDLGVRPELVAVCDTNPQVLAWYERLRPAPRLVSDWHELFADESIEAVYCAVPHHLHEELYTAALRAEKHLLGEKPFGIDLPANEAINREIAARPELLVRCSSELPFYPGGQEVARFVRERRFGQRDRGPLALPPFQRPRPGEADQLEAARGAERCVRLSRRSRHARPPPAAPRRLGAAERAGDPDGRGARTPGWSRRHGALRHVGQRRPPLRGGGRRGIRFRSGSRPSGSRRAKRTRGRSRSTAPKPRSRTRPSSRRRSGHSCSSGACRRPGGRSISDPSLPTRPSRARSSSSASRTRSSRCGQRSSTSSHTGASTCASPSTARRLKRPRPRTACSRQRSSHKRAAAVVEV